MARGRTACNRGYQRDNKKAHGSQPQAWACMCHAGSSHDSCRDASSSVASHFVSDHLTSFLCISPPQNYGKNRIGIQKHRRIGKHWLQTASILSVCKENASWHFESHTPLSAYMMQAEKQPETGFVTRKKRAVWWKILTTEKLEFNISEDVFSLSCRVNKTALRGKIVKVAGQDSQSSGAR